MKKLLLALVISAMTLNAYSGDVIVWNNETLTLHIPSINNQEGTQILSSAKLIQRENGLFELTGLVPNEPPVENCPGGTPAGVKAFTVHNNTGHYANFYVGDVFETESRQLVIITGMIDSGTGHYDMSYSFALAPNALPEPEYGLFIQQGLALKAPFIHREVMYAQTS